MRSVSARFLLAAAFCVGLPLSTAGCGSSLADLCTDYCDCEGGCSDRDIQECEDAADDAEKAAADEGCENQFDDLVSCLNDQAQCFDGGKFDADGCNKESEDFKDCAGFNIDFGLD